MRKILKHILNTSVLLLTGIVFAGCSSSDAPIEQPINPTVKYTMTVNASKGSDATTRALSIDGSGKLIASWATTENVYVKKGDSWLSGSLTPQAASTSAVLKGEVTGATIAAEDNLTLQFPRTTIDYTGQVGTLDNIAANYDYATATTTVSSVNGNTFTSSNADFTNQQAIVKFTLQNAYGETLAVDKLTVSATGLKTSDIATGDIAITPASATDVIYAALSGISGQEVTLTATKGSDTYALTTPSTVSFTDGNYYTITAKLRPPIFYEPLTFERVDDDCKVSFTSYNSGKLEYSRDKVTWTAYTTGITLTSTNPIVYFRGDKATKYGSDSESTKITCDKKCKVYGNIMSLIDPTHYATLTELPGTYVFHELFKKDTENQYDLNNLIINHETKDLVLPATTLTSACYEAMFNGCAGLTRAPVLPAPALVANCYEMMFADCIKLKYIKCLATDISATDCTKAWVGGTDGVFDTGTFVRDPNMPYDTTSGWPRGEHGIPSGWSVTPE